MQTDEETHKQKTAAYRISRLVSDKRTIQVTFVKSEQMKYYSPADIFTFMIQTVALITVF
jgi:hypothetical protein